MSSIISLVKSYKLLILLLGILLLGIFLLVSLNSFNIKLTTTTQLDKDHNNNYEKDINSFYTPYHTENDYNLILRYLDLPLVDEYGSAVIPLAYTILKLQTVGDIIEYGSGIYSTNLLHKITYDLKRKLISLDTDNEWLIKFAIFNETYHHRIYYVGRDDIENHRVNEKWAVAFVDHGVQTRRPANAINLALSAQVVVIHDTNEIRESIYQFIKNGVYDKFKYNCKYTFHGGMLQTNILSNFIPLDEFCAELTKLSDYFKKIHLKYKNLKN
jgi:hypothetical protein